MLLHAKERIDGPVPLPDIGHLWLPTVEGQLLRGDELVELLEEGGETLGGIEVDPTEASIVQAVEKGWPVLVHELHHHPGFRWG